jgi:sec-independent protein translocase protein TatA
MPFQLGLPEIILVLLIALLVLGPKRLPEAGRTAGRGIKEFKDAFSGVERSGADAGSASASAHAPGARYVPPRPYEPPPPALDPGIYVPHAELGPPRAGR